MSVILPKTKRHGVATYFSPMAKRSNALGKHHKCKNSALKGQIIYKYNLPFQGVYVFFSFQPNVTPDIHRDCVGLK